MEKTQELVRKFYMSTLSISNVIKELEDDKLLKTSWSLGLTELQKNVEWIEEEMLSMGYSLDYHQATTFKAYIKITLFLIGRLKDELVSKEEGMHTVQLAKGLMIQSFKPFSAFICKRVKELDILPHIPEIYRGLYYGYNEDFSMADNDYLSKLFSLAFEEDETYEERVALEEEVEAYFKGSMTMNDLEIMRQIIHESSQRTITENSLELDF